MTIESKLNQHEDSSNRRTRDLFGVEIYENEYYALKDFFKYSNKEFDKRTLKFLTIKDKTVTEINNFYYLWNLHSKGFFRKDNFTLSYISDSVSEFKNIKTINLTNNPLLTEISDSFGGLSSLENLNLSRNELKYLPNSFGGLSHLNRLVLSNNNLSKLPSSLSRLSYLKRLVLSSNYLTSIPSSFGKLSSLELLNLSGNELESLPQSLGNCSKLNNLILSYNTNILLPESLTNLPKLKKLSFRGNFSKHDTSSRNYHILRMHERNGTQIYVQPYKEDVR